MLDSASDAVSWLLSMIGALVDATWVAIENAGVVSVLSFASIPIFASLIGYGTNVLAIQMTFLPLEYIGWFEGAFRATGFSLGWQGIIPANGVKIAQKAVTIITTRLVTVAEVFSRLEKARLIELMREPLLKSMERVLDRVAGEHAPDIWEAMPLLARHELAVKACEESEPYIGAIIDDMRVNIEEYLDLWALAVDHLTEDKALMNEVFKRCGAEEVTWRRTTDTLLWWISRPLVSLLLNCLASAPNRPRPLHTARSFVSSSCRASILASFSGACRPPSGGCSLSSAPRWRIPRCCRSGGSFLLLGPSAAT